MPKQLAAGILYVAEEYGAAAHLCACGCGVKIRTPLGPTEWTLVEGPSGPTLIPSIGNWQHACQSHYWVCDGRIVWAQKWSREEILAGQQREEMRREAYFDQLERERGGLLKRLWNWIVGLFSSE